MIMKVLIIIILPIIYTYKTRKNLKTCQKKVKEKWGKIDSLLKTRNDIIPDLLQVVETYVRDIETIDNVNNTRDDLLSSKTKKDKIKNSNKLTSELNVLFSITENYSDLKNNEKFLDLQNKIHDTEDQINKSRKNYNSSVTNYSNKINTFPSNIVAYVFKFKPVEIFTEDKSKNNDVKIDEIEVLDL